MSGSNLLGGDGPLSQREGSKCLSEEVGQDASLAWSLGCHPIRWIQWWTVLLGIGKSSPGCECGTGDLPERYPSLPRYRSAGISQSQKSGNRILCLPDPAPAPTLDPFLVSLSSVNSGAQAGLPDGLLAHPEPLIVCGR